MVVHFAPGSRAPSRFRFVRGHRSRAVVVSRVAMFSVELTRRLRLTHHISIRASTGRSGHRNRAKRLNVLNAGRLAKRAPTAGGSTFVGGVVNVTSSNCGTQRGSTSGGA